MSSLFMTWHHCYAACCCSSTQTPLLPHHAALPRTPGQQTHSHHTPLTQCQNHFPSKYGNSRELSAVLTSSCGTESLKPHWGYYLLNKKKKKAISAGHLTTISGDQQLLLPLFIMTGNFSFPKLIVKDSMKHPALCRGSPSSMHQESMIHVRGGYGCLADVFSFLQGVWVCDGMEVKSK